MRQNTFRVVLALTLICFVASEYQFTFEPAADVSDETDEVTLHENIKHFNASDYLLYDEAEDLDEGDEIDEVQDRSFGSDQFTSECKASERTIIPAKLPNIHKIEKKMIKQDGKYFQSVTIRECETPNESCSRGVSSGKDFAHVCRQKFVKIILKIEGPEESDEFYFPSYCACQLVKKRN